MILAKLKNTNENIIVLIPSKTYKGVYEDKKNGNVIIDYSTLNLVINEDGKKMCVGDDDIEIIKEIDD